MQDSPPSLLQRLRTTDDRTAWGRLVDLLTPLFFFWGCRAGLSGSEAADLVKDLLALVADRLPSLPEEANVRSWLRSLAHARWREVMSQRTVAGRAPGEGP